jgi:hypothetical protein
MYVSSIRQLTHTGRLRRWKASSSCGLYLMTHQQFPLMTCES